MKKNKLPKQAKLYFSKSVRYCAKNKLEKALEYLNKAIDVYPDCYKFYNCRATLYETFNNTKQAIEDLTKSIQLNPKSSFAYNFSGLLYCMKFDDFKKALADYTKAIEVNPNNYEGYYNRANIYSQEELYDLSIKDYSISIKLKPDYFQAYTNRGKDYCYIKEFEKAENDFLTALDIAKNSKGSIYLSYYNLGNLESVRENYRKAVKYFTEAINQKISLFLKIESYYERGLCQTCCCNFEEAISDFTIAIDLAEMDINYSDRLQGFREIRSAAYEALEVKKEIEQESLFWG